MPTVQLFLLHFVQFQINLPIPPEAVFAVWNSWLGQGGKTTTEWLSTYWNPLRLQQLYFSFYVKLRFSWNLAKLVHFPFPCNFGPWPFIEMMQLLVRGNVIGYYTTAAGGGGGLHRIAGWLRPKVAICAFYGHCLTWCWWPFPNASLHDIGTYLEEHHL